MNADKTIRVDREVYAEIAKRVESLTDTPNSILRRILGLSDAARR